jgi:mRNA-degrading endonuclease RelE of RelBE toxin-antitoxin system
MIFIETPVFTALVQSYLTDEDYSKVQHALLMRPGAGVLIPGSHGLRKLSWRTEHGGKRGGLRIIYYWYVEDEAFYMLFIYRKNEQEDLTRQQIKVLSRLIEEALE